MTHYAYTTNALNSDRCSNDKVFVSLGSGDVVVYFRNRSKLRTLL